MLSYPKSRTRKLAIGAVGTLLASAALATPTMAAEPPAAGHEVISFPQRDFVSASGYAKGVPAYAQVIRAGHVVATSTPVLPQDDPATAAFDGIVEVNHAGGGCWDTVTPDIRPGDKVRVYQDDPADPAAATQINDDTTTTAAVTAGPAVVEGGVLTVHGTAQTLDLNGVPTGKPLPLDQIEQRLIHRDKFLFNGRRDLRAPRDGTLTYDATGGITWTAKYPRVTRPEDIARAQAGESRVLWLGRNPGAGTELTIFEVGGDVAPGPGAPCTAPLEGTTPVVLTPVAPTTAQLPTAITSISAPQGTHTLTAFPSRDFISAEGYAGRQVFFSVLRGGALVGLSDTMTVGADGLAEVNHPGGGCFLAGTQTPDIKAGDVVRITDLATGVTEQTTVANVTASKPVKGATNTTTSTTTVKVTGTALNLNGTPMSLNELEQRLINPQRFTSGRRTLRAPGDGTLNIDAAGNYTATYNLTATDLTRAMAAESRAMWLGPNATGAEMTIFETPDIAGGLVNGPQAPCIAPAEIG